MMAKRRSPTLTLMREAAIDAFVAAAIRTQRWNTLERTMRAYSRQLGVPANQLLVESMNRLMCYSVLAHPERGPQLLEQLDALEADGAANPDEPRVYPLETIVDNLRSAARSLGPVVQ